MNLQIKNIGHSSLGLPIFSYEWGSSEYPAVLILAGVHGNEVEGVVLASHLMNQFLINYPFKLNLTLIPQLNPDGVLLKTRGNGNGVDLNRNLPTKDWSAEYTAARNFPGTHPLSEPENQALVQLMKEKSFQFIFSLHSWFPLINVNGNCEKVAQVLNSWTQYKIEPDMGYPTPGCFGTYAGKESKIPTITYEIERGIDLAKIDVPHTQAFLEALKVLEGDLNVRSK